jgi:hypothetical protein
VCVLQVNVYCIVFIRVCVSCVCKCVCVCYVLECVACIVHVVCRYDNEYGYSNRVVDLLKFVYSKDHP